MPEPTAKLCEQTHGVPAAAQEPELLTFTQEKKLKQHDLKEVLGWW